MTPRPFSRRRVLRAADVARPRTPARRRTGRGGLHRARHDASRLRGLALSATVAAVSALVGLAATGGTYALLNTSGTVPGATLTAGTMDLSINGAGSAQLGTVGLDPLTPVALPFTVTNAGQAKARLSAAITAQDNSALATVMRIDVVPNPGSCVASALGASAQRLASFTSSSLADLTAGTSRGFCLLLSLPAGTDAALSGTSVNFTLTMTSEQIR
ncbi:MAG: hypothetical protein LBE25_08425 [Arthrobacter sp.]|jgi:hypothetical protein|nr:hypothetical protein [Arthrobacter sp.]